MSRGLTDTVRDSWFSSKNKEVASLRLVHDIWVASRQQGYGDKEPPALAQIQADVPDMFKVKIERGYFGSETAEVSRIEKSDLDYEHVSRELTPYSRSLLQADADTTINLLSDYAKRRNDSAMRSDSNLSYMRNRVVRWIFEELISMVKQPANAELLRQLTQLEYFLDLHTQASNVKGRYESSATNKGATGYVATMREAKRNITKMKNNVKVAMEMQSLGDMLQDFGRSLDTAVKHFGCFAVYFAADGAIKKSGAPFDIEQFYRHNVSNGMRVGNSITKRGEYERTLYESAFGKVLQNYYEHLCAIDTQEPKTNRFLMAAEDGRGRSFKEMASYILIRPTNELPGREYVWRGFKDAEYFPLNLPNGRLVQGDELAADAVMLLGLLIEAYKIAQQFKKAKGPASFVGDYNMVYNAHMHWAMQSLLQQWRALNGKITELTTKLDGVRSSLVLDRPSDSAYFIQNAAVMETKFRSATVAMNSVDTDYRAIENRMRLLHTEGYLKKKCKEAKQFVEDASNSAEELYRSGVLTEDQYNKVERYRPIVEREAHSGVEEYKVPTQEFNVVAGLQDPLNELGAFDDDNKVEGDLETKRASSGGIRGALMRFLPGSSPQVITVCAKATEYGASEEMKAFEAALELDEAFFVANYRELEGYKPEDYAKVKHDLVYTGKGLNVLFPLLVAAYEAGLHEVSTVRSKRPFHAANFTVSENSGGIMLVDNTTDPVGVIDFKQDVLLEKYGHEGENFDAMLGRYAEALSRRHSVDVRGELKDGVLQENFQNWQQYPGLQAVRFSVWQNLVAIEQALIRIQAIMDGVKAATVLPSADGRGLAADWTNVNVQCQRLSGHRLLSNGINDVSVLMDEAQKLINRTTQDHKGQYKHFCKEWSVPNASNHSCNRVVAELQNQLNKVRADATHLAGTDKHVTVGELKLRKERQFHALRVTSVEKAGEPSTRVGRLYNVAMVDRQGFCQHKVRFSSPLPDKQIKTLAKPQRDVMSEFFAGKAFSQLTKRIQSNQASYDKYELNFRDKPKKSSEFNYVVIGAAKASNMQAYMNGLRLRLDTALKASPANRDRAWASVYDWLGGPAGQVNFKDRLQRDAFLTSDKLSFSVRLRNKIGEVNPQDTEFTALTHRHGSHGDSRASNLWGMRGLSSLPATTELFLSFVKQARQYLDAHVARPVAGPHAHA
ncbi:MAG: hypothetical protein P1U63_02150 [Coxiellaceae bacterium]|nr:hypothetical protein [Coxiellaceae bacterium]